ncbi:hypothetical protein LINPERHAP2_LOCUS23577, partial [Linum perenne]
SGLRRLPTPEFRISTAPLLCLGFRSTKPTKPITQDTNFILTTKISVDRRRKRVTETSRSTENY